MDFSQLPTYQVTVYQSRAHRAIRTRIENLLRQYNLTMMQWSILGYVHEAGAAGIRISDLAHKIDTSLAFITNSINTLEAKGVVGRSGYAADNRAKLVRVSEDYKDKIVEIETVLHAAVNDWFYKNIEDKDLTVYLKVLQQIAERETAR
ncbi:MAG TPA: MarR family transcriptional regulator [Patescibacteria group bacterium]|nr:MarR family transcriptional regulator [Patescibacteria group bacterium]